MNKFVILILILILVFLIFKNIDKGKINNDIENEEYSNMKIKLEINNYELTATLVDNSSTQA